MSVRLLTIGLMAAIGIVAPFLIMRRVLDYLYVPDIAGTPPPAMLTVPGYALALLIAVTVFAFASAKIRSDKTPPAPDEPLQSEELPE